MAEAVIGVGRALISIISKAIELWEQKSENVEVLRELKQFVQGLQLNILDLQKKSTGAHCSNTTTWALDALGSDLENAKIDALNILNEGFIKSIWDANKTRAKLQALRERVMTSFQTRILFATLDVVIESKQGQEDFQKSMLRVNTQLIETYSTNSSSIKSMEDALRKELKQVLQPVMAALQKQGGINAAMAMIHDTNAQTSETEKFFADVLEGLKQHSNMMNVSDDKSNNDQLQWYQDPITWEKMCDPVKATDGHTYDRWTIVRHASSMACSPLSREDQQTFHIVVDDISLRSRLFHEFPEQEKKFKDERAAYKHEALQAAHLGRLGDALVMLNNVLQWNPPDVECRNKRDDIQHQIVTSGISEISPIVAREREAILPTGHDDWNNHEHLDSLVYNEGLNNHEHLDSLVYNEALIDNYSQLGTADKVQLFRNIIGANNPTGFDSIMNEPNRLDEYAGSMGNVVLSTDGLTATYNIQDSTRSVLLHANLPCPYLPFYYFEMKVERPALCEDCEQQTNVAIGFSCTKETGQLCQPLGMYLGSCGYYSVSGAIVYYDKKKRQVEYIDGVPFKLGDTVGAGFQTYTGNVFFTLQGEVVALIEEAVFNHLPGPFIFPSAALQNGGAGQIKLNFGSGSHAEPCPTRLNEATFSQCLDLKPDGLSLRRQPHKDTGTSPYVSILADKPVPLRTTVYYFEITIQKRPFWSSSSGLPSEVAIGFSGAGSFQRYGYPGCWSNSIGYCSYTHASASSYGGNINISNRLHFPAMHPSNETSFATPGDRIGAGVHFGSNEIFFIKNGHFMGSFTNTLKGSLTPTLALKNGAKVTVRFGLDIMCHMPSSLQSTLIWTRDSISQEMRVSSNGLTASHSGIPGFTGVVSFRGNHVIFDESRKDYFYFELTVKNSGKDGQVMIGYCHYGLFESGMEVGSYAGSCGYHGKTGKLYTGSIKGEEFGPAFSDGDVVGAGVSFRTETIFFVKNGKLIGSTPKRILSCALYPVVSLGSPHAKVRLNFGRQFPINVIS